MTTLIVDHEVADYGTWRHVYDSVEGARARGGVTSHRVLQDANNPNHVVVEHVFPDAAAAAAFLENVELREAMGRGGVVPSSVRAVVLEETA
jgi:quinol monooxygenase YgiN